MDEEALEYRRQRGAQEREQKQRYQQWEQERARERDPRYDMNGCGDLVLSLSSLDDHQPLVTAEIPDSGRRLAHIVRESRRSPRPLWRTVNDETVGVPWLVNVQPWARRRSMQG